MNFDFLYFLAQPWFVIPWYGFGILAAAWSVYDMLMVNTQVNAPLKAAWPIIIVFFSVLGLAFYFWTCRPPGVATMNEARKEEVHHDYVDNLFFKTTGALIHCVGGDGLGIMTAMVALRLIGVSFWVEFWIEYVVGFAFGWLIFQLWAFLLHGNSLGEALFKAFRAEFFSMMTVMIGMGLVMANVTPKLVGEPPTPDMAAFWGFSAFGLLVGTVLTVPVNLALIKLGWKNGMA